MLHVATSEESTRNGSGRDSRYSLVAQMSSVALPLLVVLGAGIRFFYLERQSLWFDEGVGLIFSGCGAISGCLQAMLDTRTSEKFQFVYPLILHEWRLLFGSSEIALRSLSVLCNVAAMALVGLTARRVFGLSHALWSLAFMALSGFTIVHAQEARPYTFFLLIAAAQIWLFMGARGGSMPARLGLYAVTAFASWAGFFPLLFSVALALADAIERPLSLVGLRRWLLWWLPAGALCGPALLYYAWAAIATSPDDVSVPRTPEPVLNLAFLVYGQLVGQTFGPSVEALRGPERFHALLENAPLLLAFAAVVAITVIHAAHLWRRRIWHAHSGARVLVLTGVCYCGLLLFFVLLTRHNLLPRHAVALHAVLALLLPCLVTREARRIGGSIIAALLALNVVAIGRQYFDPAQWKDDYRGAASYLREVGEPQRPVLLLRGLPVLFAYYGYEGMTTVMDAPRTSVPEIVARAADGHHELVIVVNRESDLWPDVWLERALEPGFYLRATKRLSYFAIYTFARR